MDTRLTRKRSWAASPEKKTARTSLDFENTPPRKKFRDSSTESPESEEDARFTTKSFYGGREKKSYPHSPRRRKAASQVLSKLDSHEEEEEFLSLKTNVPGEVLNVNNKNKTDVFKYSSTSSESEAVDILKERNRNVRVNGSKKISPKSKGKASAKKKPTKKSPLIKKPSPKSGSKAKQTFVLTDTSQNKVKTDTPSSGRKFFKSKSPASASKTFGSVVISKGFNLKFLPKRRSSSNLPKESPSDKLKKVKTQEVFDDSSEKEIGNSYDSGFSSKSSEIPSQCTPKEVVAESAGSPARSPKLRSSHTNSPGRVLELTPSKIVQQRQTGSPRSPRLRTAVNRNEMTPTKQRSCDNPSGSPRLRSNTPRKDNQETPTKLNVPQSPRLRTSQRLSPRKHLTPSKSASQGVNERGAKSPGGKTKSPQKSSSQLTQESDVVSIDGSADLFTDSNKTDETGSEMSGPSVRPERKYFSIFNASPSNSPMSSSSSLKSLRKESPRHSPRLMAKLERDHKEQMVLDVGQKKFGAVQCEVCGMVYRHADPGDEATHNRFHNDLLNTLKFPGWKKERVAQEFPEDCSRIIMVSHDDPKYAVKKIEDINSLMGREMGFPEASLSSIQFKAFLYISEEKKVEGCCIAEPITQGYRVIPDSQPSQQDIPQPGHRPWYCRSEPEEAAVGISRIWVFGQQRRKGIASKLLDSVRQWFQYGGYIKKNQMAFSDPTSDGKQLASKYTGTPEFLVYKYI